MPRIVKCGNFDCDNELGERYFAVLRIIAKGNKRRRWTFCSTKCLVNFVSKWDTKKIMSMGITECCICGKVSIFGLSVLKYGKEICTACKASFVGLLNFEHDKDVPINDSMGFTFFTPNSYTHYPTGKKVTVK